MNRACPQPENILLSHARKLELEKLRVFTSADAKEKSALNLPPKIATTFFLSVVTSLFHILMLDLKGYKENSCNVFGKYHVKIYSLGRKEN